MKILGVCGAQGALLHRSQSHVIANVEPRGCFHTKREEQWKLNFGDIPFVRSFEELPESVSLEDIDLIVGSPSCGHSSAFSYSRKKSLGEPQSDPSLNLFFDSITQLQPKCFVMENLPKLIELYPLEEINKRFPEYELKALCHPVSVFGNPQIHRKRLLLIGILKFEGKKSNPFSKVPWDIRGVFPSQSFDQLCENVRPKLNYINQDSKTVAMYHFSDKTKRSLTLKEVRELWQGEFKDEYRWPMTGHRMKSLPGVYRLDGNKPPKTLRPSNRQFAPDGSQLGLEHFRIIMGFPTTYHVYIDFDNYDYWLNKARITFTKGAVYEVGAWLFSIFKLSGLIR